MGIHHHSRINPFILALRQQACSQPKVSGRATCTPGAPSWLCRRDTDSSGGPQPLSTAKGHTAPTAQADQRDPPSNARYSRNRHPERHRGWERSCLCPLSWGSWTRPPPLHCCYLAKQLLFLSNNWNEKPPAESFIPSDLRVSHHRLVEQRSISKGHLQKSSLL